MNRAQKIFYFLFILTILIISIMFLKKYIGSWYVYMLFTIAFNLLLILGFIGKKIFFETYIGIYFWLGFWLKTTIRVIYFELTFHESVGAFDYSAKSFDKALLVASIGAIGLIAASLVRRKFFNYEVKESEDRGVFLFYNKYRYYIWILFLAASISWSYFNLNLGIYQRGEIPRTVLPGVLTGGLKWLLLFGGATLSSYILNFEARSPKSVKFIWAGLLGLLEATFSTVSMLSRGMVLNSGALIWGVQEKSVRQKLKIPLISKVSILVIFILLFISSAYYVNHMRKMFFYEDHRKIEFQADHRSVKVLFLDRWIGIEGVMSITSSPKQGFATFTQALNEEYVMGQLSYYDSKMIKSSYANTNLFKHNFISLPGIIAFFSYPNSNIFLFFAMFCVGLIAYFIEFLTIRASGNNIILCSVIGQVIAYRYVHFGYVPKQSYLLFMSIILNLLIIFIVRKLLNRLFNSENLKEVLIS